MEPVASILVDNGSWKILKFKFWLHNRKLRQLRWSSTILNATPSTKINILRRKKGNDPAKAILKYIKEWKSLLNTKQAFYKVKSRIPQKWSLCNDPATRSWWNLPSNENRHLTTTNWGNWRIEGNGRLILRGRAILRRDPDWKQCQMNVQSAPADDRIDVVEMDVYVDVSFWLMHLLFLPFFIDAISLHFLFRIFRIDWRFVYLIASALQRMEHPASGWPTINSATN